MIWKSISTLICLFIVSAILLCGCTTVTTQPPQTSSPPATTEQQLTDPTLATEIVPDATGITEILTEMSIPTISYENWWLTSGVTKYSFGLAVGSECIREAPYKSYAVIQDESGHKRFIFFDKREITCGAGYDRTFHTNEEFLDFVVGTCPSPEEMVLYDNFRYTQTNTEEVYYTQQGVFIISYPYDIICIDGEPQETVRYVRILAYCDYEEIETIEELYGCSVWYILPEDRTQ